MIGDGKNDYGEPQGGDFPLEDSDRTWHIHETPIEVPHEEGSNVAFLSTWGWGIRCTACFVKRADHTKGKKVTFAISRLKNTNEAGVTQNELRQEIYDNAREGGYDIERAR